MSNVIKILMLLVFTSSYSLYSSESLIIKIANMVCHTAVSCCYGGIGGYMIGVTGTGFKLLYDNSRSTQTSPIHEEVICGGNSLDDCTLGDLFFGPTNICPAIGGAVYGVLWGMLCGIRELSLKGNNTNIKLNKNENGKYTNGGFTHELKVKIPVN